jgi:outer membrane biosynthesis protein TonB
MRKVVLYFVVIAIVLGIVLMDHSAKGQFWDHAVLGRHEQKPSTSQETPASAEETPVLENKDEKDAQQIDSKYLDGALDFIEPVEEKKEPVQKDEKVEEQKVEEQKVEEQKVEENTSGVDSKYTDGVLDFVEGEQTLDREYNEALSSTEELEEPTEEMTPHEFPGTLSADSSRYETLKSISKMIQGMGDDDTETLDHVARSLEALL